MSEPRRSTGWEAARVPVICEACDWRYWAAAGQVPERCPHCAASTVVEMSANAAGFPYEASPELAVPFAVSEAILTRRVESFADGIPLPPDDLSFDVLKGRLRKLYLPMWLVDSNVQAQWQAEMGFDYEVVSHQERYADGAGWRTAEVRETRVRWEPRVGQLTRHYDNVSAPALTAHRDLARVLGEHDRRAAVAFSAAALGDVLVRAPDRSPEAAWPEAEMGVRRRAMAECQTAAGADHVREFRWAPSYDGATWTLLLLPVYATYYLDDDGDARQVLINGQTGQLTGARRGSLARAHRRSLIIGIVALVLLLLSIALGLAGLLFPPLVVVAVLGALLAVAIGAGAIVPTARVVIFNRRQRDSVPAA